MNCFKGNGFSFELNKRTYVMGILNVTPDSFFDGGAYNSVEKAVKRAIQIEKEGADIIDIGAQSTKPDCKPISEYEELEIIKEFLIPVVNAVSIPVSVDTFNPKVAEYSLENGAEIINDVSGSLNGKMAELIKKYNAGWIIMHNPSSAAEPLDYGESNGVVNAVNEFFLKAEKTAREYGIPLEGICLDSGVGFGKTYEDNILIIKNTDKFKTPTRAVLTALSCKRVTGEATGAEGDERLFPTIAANTVAISGKTDFIRVHHVREAVLAAKMTDEIIR